MPPLSTCGSAAPDNGWPNDSRLRGSVDSPDAANKRLLTTLTLLCRIRGGWPGSEIMNRIAADDLTPSEQEVERLLTAFFEHEVPQPWPAFEPPVARRTLSFRPDAPRRRRFVLGSKLAL